MTTPAGYYDENGNFIPGSFADQLNLPGPQGTDTAAAMEAQQALEKAQGGLTITETNVKNSAARLKAYQKQAASKKLTASQKKAINAKIAKERAYQAAQTKVQAERRKSVTSLQTKYYEVSGQYEKLLTGETRDAYASLKALFSGYGLESLAPKVYEFAKQGYGADVISLLLQDTKEYKERFSANEIRKKAGLPVLSPAEYLETESAYRQVLNSAGLPKGFYDSPKDFANWLAGDVSPTEVKNRVDIAVSATAQAPEATKRALFELYGVDQAHAVAFALDSTRALPILQKQAQAAQFGGEALRRGLALNRTNLEDFVTSGLSLSQVQQGYQAVAEALPNIQAIAARYGETFSQGELEQDIIGGTQLAGLGESRRRRLASQERALFGGAGGATPGGLSTGFQAT